MKRRVQDYWCSHCMCRTGVLVELADDVPNSMDSCPPTSVCEHCSNTQAYRVFCAPALMTKAAIPDGVSRGDAWKIAREVAAIQSDSFDLAHDKRLTHQKEIQRLEARSATLSHRNIHEPSKPRGDSK